MRQDLLNPYMVGGSLSDPGGAAFVGRDDVFAFVQQSVQVTRRVPIILYGQRRIGKSSILKQLPYHLSPGSVCVYYDLQGKASLDLGALLYGLARAIADACELARPNREQASEDTFERFLNDVTARLGSPERLVLLFDEFDVIDVGVASATASSRFLAYMGQLAERRAQVGYILVLGRKTSELSDEFFGSILRNSVHYRLGRLSRTQADQLVTRLGTGTLHFDEPALAAVFHHAAGHPYCTQLLCHVLWNRLALRATTMPVVVTAAQVDAAVREAVEFGTNGLNWIYDSLERSSHRLFLGALAELLEHGGSQPAPLAEIEARLFRSGAPVDAAELRSTPMRLADWDVLDNTPEGFRFTVPMIGLWISMFRALVELEQETRLINPRAWRFYELAALSQQNEDFDAAIHDYERALAANPALVEAYLALATCYRARNAENDRSKAIEAFERALDVDPNAPRKGLAGC